MPVLVVGSIGLDDIKTPIEEQTDLLGGSTSYASVAASFFAPVNLVGIVGDDFPKEHIDFFRAHQIDLAGLSDRSRRARPSAEVRANTCGTSIPALKPRMHRPQRLRELRAQSSPAAYDKTPYVLLGNIHPNLQRTTFLDCQMQRPRFVIADTMDLWDQQHPEELINACWGCIDMLSLNDSEARMLTKQTSLIKAAMQIRNMGPAYLCIKKGEHGALLFGPEGQFFSCGAYPLEDIHDPTGAGDTFAGGLAGHLASLNHATVTFDSLRKAVVLGSVLASYNVEAFSLERLRTLTKADIEERYQVFKRMSQFEVIG